MESGVETKDLVPDFSSFIALLHVLEAEVNFWHFEPE